MVRNMNKNKLSQFVIWWGILTALFFTLTLGMQFVNMILPMDQKKTMFLGLQRMQFFTLPCVIGTSILFWGGSMIGSIIYNSKKNRDENQIAYRVLFYINLLLAAFPCLFQSHYFNIYSDYRHFFLKSGYIWTSYLLIIICMVLIILLSVTGAVLLSTKRKRSDAFQLTNQSLVGDYITKVKKRETKKPSISVENVFLIMRFVSSPLLILIMYCLALCIFLCK